MKRKKLFWKFYPLFLWASLVALIAVTAISFVSFRTFFYNQKEADLEVRTILLENEIASLLKAEAYEDLQKLLLEKGTATKTRITVILPSGKVVADSEANPEEMESHNDRPEVVSAMNGLRSRVVRYSYTLNTDFIYIASLIKSDDKLLGIVRASMPLNAINKNLNLIYQTVFFGFLFLLVVLALLSWWISVKMSKPLEEMKSYARKIAKGDFLSRVNLDVSSSKESFELGKAMNEIAIQLDQRIKTITNQKNEQEAVLSSMLEGVIAIDQNEKIIHLNNSAAKILEREKHLVEGALIQEVIRHSQLQGLITRGIKDNAPIEKEIEILKEKKVQYLQVHCTPLLNVDSKNTGIVVVINDITKLKELENHRSEFVANVSHELRTPLTNIQGFTETLLNSPEINDSEKQDFLNTIYSHAIRLGAIIEDLLSLSRFEKDTEDIEVELSEGSILEVINKSLEACVRKVQEEKVTVKVECEESIVGKINSPLLEQAVINLLENAIKYSSEGMEIKINVTKKIVGTESERGIIISVIDEGAGIEARHLPRIFERFYRVDKARSRAVGGTGLGLAIVKHIVLAHGGDVSVESQLGVGSTFYVQLPEL